MLLTKIITHRVYSASYPDNTWVAIRATQTAGAEYCEIDIVLSADGEVIVCHDYYIGEHRIDGLAGGEAQRQLMDLPRFEAIRLGFVTSLMLGTVFDFDEMVLLSHCYQCDTVHLCWKSRAPYPNRLLSREAITRLHEAGLKVILWHEEREEELWFA